MMMGQAAMVWSSVGAALHLAGAIAAASLGFWLWPRRVRFGRAGMPIVVALFLTAIWAVTAAATADLLTVSFAESARNLSWLAAVYALFASDGRHASLAPIRPVIYALVFVEVLHLSIDLGLSRLAVEAHILQVAFDCMVMFRLLVAVGGLVLVHNLYAGAPRDARGALRWPAAGLAVLWAFDLNLYTMAYLGNSWPTEMAALRGLATFALVACLAIGTARNRDELRLRPSRAVTFQTFSLLVIGVYLVAMVSVGQWLAYAGGNFARLIELAFLTLASAFALVVLPSRRVRGWLKVST